MQPRTLDQIIAELQPSYQPSIEFLRQRQAEIPKTVEADIQAAQAAQTQAYEDILTGARRRGLGFAGIPLGEQARYASTVFAPSILAARAKGTQAGQNLEQTILGLQGEMRQAAINQRNAELNAAQQLAAVRATGGGGGPSYSFGDTGQGAGTTGSGVTGTGVGVIPQATQEELEQQATYDTAKQLLESGNEMQIRDNIMRLRQRWYQNISQQEKDAITRDIQIYQQVLGNKLQQVMTAPKRTFTQKVKRVFGGR